ncbi:MAG: hypothetical protein IPG89_14100 [Bacteroidetes bacterium]|nr:hypothetical protein [Bacteroidota bacterium]
MKTLTLLFILLITTSIAQNKQSIIIGEDFDGMSSYKWPTQNDAKMKAAIDNDHYNIDVKVAGNAGYFTIPGKINEKGEYNIKTKISNSTVGKDEHMFGLVWGAKSKDECFIFFINTVKQIFSVYKYSGGKATALLPWTKCPEIKTDGSANELSIITMKSNWYFYINNKAQKKTPMQAFAGNEIGIYTMGKVNIKVDEFYVSSEK